MTETAPIRYSFQELTELDRLDVDALRSLFTIEMAGEAFYHALADRVGNEQAAGLLRRNGREEAGHARRAARAIALKLGHDFEPTPDMLERRETRLPDTIGPDLLPTLVQGELAGDATYQRWADHESDAGVARLLRLNGREESMHGRRVEQAIALLAEA
jgi:rubrerythrin